MRTTTSVAVHFNGARCNLRARKIENQAREMEKLGWCICVSARVILMRACECASARELPSVS